MKLNFVRSAIILFLSLFFLNFKIFLPYFSYTPKFKKHYFNGKDESMKLKIARNELSATPKTISLEEVEEEMQKTGQQIFYFDRENSHKDLIAVIEFFEKKGLSVYHRVVKYGLDENEYMYEVHIL